MENQKEIQGLSNRRQWANMVSNEQIKICMAKRLCHGSDKRDNTWKKVNFDLVRNI